MSKRALEGLIGCLLLSVTGACMDYKLNNEGEVDAPAIEDTGGSAPQDTDPPEEPPDTDPPDTEPPEEEPPDTDPPDTEPEEEPPAEPEAGCADGEREGYLDWDAYPDIAACSGAWSVPGVTRDDLAPTCGNQGGDDGPGWEGEGCSAADLCAPGWQVCGGHAAVEERAGSCDDAVPEGTPDKALLFAVRQHSVDGTVCDDGAASANDVFGCGNLGHTLSEDKGCGVLNRALASTQPGTCGYNEAEPGHGPWECAGGDDSHLEEGALVTKDGCWGDSCSYDGYPVGSSDKGGVLCCRE